MEINAVDIEGDVNARLSAVEAYYLRAKKAGDQCCKVKYARQHAAMADVLSKVADFRLHLNMLRENHFNDITRALEGEPVTLTLNSNEAMLVDAIRDLYVSTMTIRHRHVPLEQE